MQEFIVGMIVAYAFWVVAKRYAPKIARQTIRRSLVRSARNIRLIALAEKLEKEAEDSASCGSGCGKCGSCDSDSPTAQVAEKVVAMPTSLKQSRGTS